MTDKDAKTAGGVAVAVGCGLAIACVYLPIRNAQAHAAQIQLSAWWSIFVPILLIRGALALIFGTKCDEYLGTRFELKPLGILFTIAVIVLGFMTFFLVMHIVESYGYHFNGG